MPVIDAQGTWWSMTDNHLAIAAAYEVMDALIRAMNARDVEAFKRTFNFPSVRLASNALAVIEEEDLKPGMFERGALAEWDHSAWERREIVHSGPDKVHIDARFTRFRKDGSILGSFDTIYVVTCENGHWGVKARSTFAP